MSFTLLLAELVITPFKTLKQERALIDRAVRGDQGKPVAPDASYNICVHYPHEINIVFLLFFELDFIKHHVRIIMRKTIWLVDQQ